MIQNSPIYHKMKFKVIHAYPIIVLPVSPIFFKGIGVRFNKLLFVKFRFLYDGHLYESKVERNGLFFINLDSPQKYDYMYVSYELDGILLCSAKQFSLIKLKS